jgi:hypothetical protein
MAFMLVGLGAIPDDPFPDALGCCLDLLLALKTVQCLVGAAP